jgi:hypothetical protein
MDGRATRSATLEAGLAAADREAREAYAAATRGVPHKECPRCDGKGHAFFLGGSRAPGVCFRCAGSGRVPAGRDAAKAVREAAARAETQRLARCRAAVAAALADAEGDLRAGGSSWAVRAEIKGLAGRLASYDAAISAGVQQQGAR